MWKEIQSSCPEGCNLKAVQRAAVRGQSSFDQKDFKLTSSG